MFYLINITWQRPHSIPDFQPSMHVILSQHVHITILQLSNLNLQKTLNAFPVHSHLRLPALIPHFSPSESLLSMGNPYVSLTFFCKE